MMRSFQLRAAILVALATMMAMPVSAGVRGKPSKLKPASVERVAQTEVGDMGIQGTPVPIPPEAVHVLDERVISESPATVARPARTDCPPVAAGPMAAPMVMPVLVAPVMMAPVSPMPQAPTWDRWEYANPTMSMHPNVATGYQQAFGPGLYRSGAEAGMNHYPYYSYRRPWYFPGQPSFQRSTDYVW